MFLDISRFKKHGVGEIDVGGGGGVHVGWL